jgi:hypothetical protein
MTTIGLKAVGFCAHYSRQGDWAFDFALRLSREKSLQLNVFHFLADPYNPEDTTGKNMSHEERSHLAIELERELRMYYDELAGDYLNVGFRLCEDNEWTELHRCLVKREFQVLVLGHVGKDSMFGGKPIIEFANAFVSPVVLVGPKHPDEFYVNASAALISDTLGLGSAFLDTSGTAPDLEHCLSAGPRHSSILV